MRKLVAFVLVAACGAQLALPVARPVWHARGQLLAAMERAGR